MSQLIRRLDQWQRRRQRRGRRREDAPPRAHPLWPDGLNQRGEANVGSGGISLPNYCPQRRLVHNEPLYADKSTPPPTTPPLPSRRASPPPRFPPVSCPMAVVCLKLRDAPPHGRGLCSQWEQCPLACK